MDRQSFGAFTAHKSPTNFYGSFFYTRICRIQQWLRYCQMLTDNQSKNIRSVLYEYNMQAFLKYKLTFVEIMWRVDLSFQNMFIA